MSVIILLLIASLSVSLAFLGAFIWSIKHKQYDDDYSPAMRILFEDHPQLPEDKKIKVKGGSVLKMKPITTQKHKN